MIANVVGALAARGAYEQAEWSVESDLDIRIDAGSPLMGFPTVTPPPALFCNGESWGDADSEGDTDDQTAGSISCSMDYLPGAAPRCDCNKWVGAPGGGGGGGCFQNGARCQVFSPSGSSSMSSPVCDQATEWKYARRRSDKMQHFTERHNLSVVTGAQESCQTANPALYKRPPADVCSPPQAESGSQPQTYRYDPYSYVTASTIVS